MPNLANRWPGRVRDGEYTVGSFMIELPARASVDCYAIAAFDFLILDLEHSAIDLETASSIVSACRAFNMGVVVRLPEGNLGNITRVLDLQPDGLMLPKVTTAAFCEDVVQRARFFPAGRRGLAPIVRHSSALGQAQSTRGLEPLLIMQVEGLTAISNIRDIAATPGVDVIFIGPYDLSQDLGLPGQLDHPQVLEIGREAAQQLPPGVVLGTYVETASQAATWHGIGATFIAAGTDGRIFLRGCCGLRKEIAHFGKEGEPNR